MPYIGRSQKFGVRTVFHFLATNGQTSVSGSDADGKALSFADGNFIDVYLNGVRLKSGEDYNTGTANTIAGLSALNANDEVNIVVYDTFTVADTVKASTGGTFSGDVTTSGTFNATGDTAAGDDASMGHTSAEGLILTGQGTTNDVTIKNDADTAVMQIPTGTDDVTFTDDISLKSDSAVIKFGADEEVTLTHNHNTGLILGGTTPSLTIGDAGAEDTKIVFDGNAQDYHIGLDDSEDALIMGLGSALGTTTHFSMDSTGAVRMFNQPAFNVNVNSTQTMSADSVTTLNMDTERFDQNADFNTTTYKFIAPVTGRYMLSTFVRIDHIDISSDYIDMRIRTSNHTYQNVYNSDLENTADGTFKTLTLAVLADMDANDEAYVTVFVEGHVASSTGTTSINTGGSTGFFGYLAC